MKRDPDYMSVRGRNSDEDGRYAASNKRGLPFSEVESVAGEA